VRSPCASEEQGRSPSNQLFPHTLTRKEQKHSCPFQAPQNKNKEKHFFSVLQKGESRVSGADK
jgi:hypothetical protein